MLSLSEVRRLAGSADWFHAEASEMTALDLVEVRCPWDRQPKETAKAFGQFVIYRDLGPTRSLAKVATIVGGTRASKPYSVLKSVEELSQRHHWVARVEAYEIAMDRHRVEARQAAITEMEEKHLAMASGLSYAVLARQHGAGEKGAEDRVEPLDPSAIGNWSELARVAETAVKIERLTRGLATDLSRGLTHVPGAQVEKLVRDLVEASLRFVPEEQRGAWLRLAVDICKTAG